MKKVTIIVFIGAFAAQDNNLSKHILGKIWVEVLSSINSL